jgi:hypothetical protein
MKKRYYGNVYNSYMINGKKRVLEHVFELGDIV